jgi:hypothetical protein
MRTDKQQKRTLLNALNGEPTENGNRTLYRMLLCDLAVGRAYFAPESYARTHSLPPNYDSFYVAGMFFFAPSRPLVRALLC